MSLPEKRLTGPEKAAIFMLALPEEYAGKIFERLDKAEVLEITQQMTSLGKISASQVDEIFLEFSQQTGQTSSLVGSLSNTEKLLKSIFSDEQVEDIMAELGGPAGKNLWEKLGNVGEEILANFLKNEHPQTIAVVLSKIRADNAAKVFPQLPEELSLDVMMRMLKMESVQKNVIKDVEETLRMEFMANLSRTQQIDPFEHIAEVFNAFDRQTEARFMEAVEDKSADAAEKIRSLMFTFDDLEKLDAAGIQTLMRVADKSKLALALKGTTDTIKDLFFNNMSERAAKLLKEDMEALGMVKLKDVDEAQLEIVMQTKKFIDNGEIQVAASGEEEELIG